MPNPGDGASAATWVPFPSLRSAGDDKVEWCSAGDDTLVLHVGGDAKREGRGVEWRGDRGGAPVEKPYFVYILASRRNGTLYIGVTNDLGRRLFEHQQGLVDGFTKTYSVHLLVWYEVHNDINEAIKREKQLKGWNRAWKIRLIEEHNSGWNDLFENING